MRKIFLFVFLILFFFLILPFKCLAAENFDTSYDVTYSVNENGSAKALLNVTLTNTTANWVASSYKIELGFEDIKNLNAYNPDGSINAELKPADSGQSIELVFNKKVVGKGKKQNFTISFDTSDIALKRGKIWEINIPGLTNQSDFSDFNVHVRVPDSFGKPAYIKPPQITNNLDFTKEQLGKSGISIAFGENQIYDFKLKYHLQNKNLFPVKTEIALPPTTNYQKMFIDNIFPAPRNVTRDNDGNWLAEYQLKPSENLEINVSGKVVLYLYPTEEDFSDFERKEYLKEKPYWETSDEKIKKLAESLKTPTAIYKYVVKKLNYDFSRVTENKSRLGAKGALNNPDSAVCLEFTDLFIALARSAGIPSREVDGFALTDNSRQRPVSLVKDILHAWPEYYDNDLKTWVMVDPTWQNTTGGVDYFNVLDFDHFAFVIRGYNSSYPIPAGGYKLAGQENIKDVDVKIANDLNLDGMQKLEIKSYFPKSALSAMLINGRITVRNISKVETSEQEAIIENNFLSPLRQIKKIDKLPPYGYTEITVNFDKTDFLTKKTVIVKIQIAEKITYSTISISPLLFPDRIILISGGVFIVIITAITIFIIARRTRRLSLPEQKK